ncbi:unnamed protein product [Cylicocyclus nassatus]|uniref:PH domain-containing protein n=1 Tax=Cylicocyclus nassatus TaxID=53992 RepID=A0AA36HEZ1_CYLNA|nr:unnamed protein product [Cylicocyclus nassatus]
MKERVDLNNNGLCIESSARILKNGKWVKRYLMCRKPTDVSVAILYVYKSKKHRLNNNSKTSLVLQNYVGFESGFELKKCTHIIALLTLEDIVVISFTLPESLVVWETWLKSTCGSSTCFYMQLQHAPNRPEVHSVLLKEVRCHLHDSRLAIVQGRPPKLLLFCDINSARINVDTNTSIVTIQPSQSTADESFIFMCPRSETFQRMLSKAKMERGLDRYLSKKNSEGDWMPEFVVPKRKEADTESQFSHTLSGLFNFFNLEPPVRPNRRINLDKEKSKSGFHVGGSSSSRNLGNLARANSLAFYHNAKPSPVKDEPAPNYVNISRHSISKPILDRERGGSDRERLYAPSRKTSRFESSFVGYENYENQDSILQSQKSNAIHRKSLPDYINAQQVPHIRKSTEENTKPLLRSPNHGYRRKSELALAHAMDRPSTSKGRSVGDLKAARLEESRYENWRKAKKFISSFKPKSQSDLNQKSKMSRMSLVKSSSTGALQFAASAPYYNDGAEESSGSLTDFDEPPPSLDLVVCETSSIQKEDSPPEGLIRPKEDVQIKPRAGVSAVLARRLAASVTGSFSKYDGERATHHYQGGPTEPLKAASPPMLEALDGIEAAVYRGQDRLKESDRRASNVSFHKVLPMPIKQPKQKKSSVSINQTSVIHVTSPRNSTSYSESTRSSSESLSSDARSRISFRKRTNSPPNVPAPILLPRQPSSHTLLQASTSGDSLESERTARTNSPTIRGQFSGPNTSVHSLQSVASCRRVDYCDVALPAVANSSSSSTSVNSRVEYVTIDPVSTAAAREASNLHLAPFERARAMSTSMTGVPILRRRSQGQSSTSDSVSLGQPTRQGFFRKYRKMRRNKKNASYSMSQLNI